MAIVNQLLAVWKEIIVILIECIKNILTKLSKQTKKKKKSHGL